MLPSGLERCESCSQGLFDVGEEFVCPKCGTVREKSVLGPGWLRDGKLPLFGRQPLGSYMGSKQITSRERHSRVSGANTRYERMKLISDHAAKDGSPGDCGRLIERVGEKLFLPRVVMMQAATMAKRMITSPHQGKRLTVADVSAYSLVAACKMEGVTSVSIREIMAAYSALGKRVSSSSMFHLMFESDVKTFARRPEEYLPRIIAKLSMNKRLGERLAKDGVREAAYLNSLREFAGEILNLCDGTSLSGKRPCALAASATYAAEALLAARESRKRRITQRECARCGDAAEYTVREQYTSLFMPLVSKLGLAREQTPPLQTAR